MAFGISDNNISKSKERGSMCDVSSFVQYAIDSDYCLKIIIVMVQYIRKFPFNIERGGAISNESGRGFG